MRTPKWQETKLSAITKGWGGMMGITTAVSDDVEEIDGAF